LLDRVRSEDLDLLVTAINVQHEVGGNLSEILESIGFTIRERVRIQGEVRVLTAQGTISGYVISFLPFGLMGVLFLLNGEYIGAMFKEPCGWAMLIFMAIIMTAGFISIRKIVQIDV
jgi:tight adherence protein B